MPKEKVNVFMSCTGNLKALYGFNQFAEIDFFSSPHMRLKLLPPTFFVRLSAACSNSSQYLKDVKLPINPAVLFKIKLHWSVQMSNNAGDYQSLSDVSIWGKLSCALTLNCCSPVVGIQRSATLLPLTPFECQKIFWTSEVSCSREPVTLCAFSRLSKCP